MFVGVCIILPCQEGAEADDEEAGAALTEAAAAAQATPDPRPAAVAAAEKSPTVPTVPTTNASTTVAAVMEVDGQADATIRADSPPVRHVTHHSGAAPGTPETPGTIGDLDPVSEAAETEGNPRVDSITPAAELTLSDVIASITDALVTKVAGVVEGAKATGAMSPTGTDQPRRSESEGGASSSKDLVPAHGGPEVANVSMFAAETAETAVAADAADATFAGAESMVAEQPPARVNSRRVDGRVLYNDCDINFPPLPSLASTNVVTTVPCRVAYITLLDVLC